MGRTVIGVDPHKRSHTAVVLDEDEEIAAQLRVAADRRQVHRLLAWANDWPSGSGRWRTSTGSASCSRSSWSWLASRSWMCRPRSRIAPDGCRASQSQDRRARCSLGRDRRCETGTAPSGRARGLLPGARADLGPSPDLVTFRHRTICRLHALLSEMVPGGAPKHLTAVKVAKMLRSVRSATAVETERRDVAKQLLEDWRWCNRRIPTVETRLHQALQAHGSTLTGIFGIGDVGAATILAIIGDVGRFRSAGHFAAYNGTAPIEAPSGDLKRHRLNQGGNRPLNAAIHIAAVTQVRHDGPGRAYFDRKPLERKTSDAGLKRQLSDVIYRHLLTDQQRREAVRGGQTGTRLASA